MAEFREEDHPRDSKGLFVVKDGAKYFKQNASYEEILGATQKKRKAPVPKETLTQSEWSEFYNRLGEIKRGGYVDKLKNGDYIITLGNNVILSTKSYIKPIVYIVVKSKNEDEAECLVRLLTQV